MNPDKWDEKDTMISILLLLIAGIAILLITVVGYKDMKLQNEKEACRHDVNIAYKEGCIDACMRSNIVPIDNATICLERCNDIGFIDYGRVVADEN